MDTAAWRILAQLLELAADQFADHTSNDFTLPNTPENRAVVEAAEKWGDPSGNFEGLNTNEAGTLIYTGDSFLMSYFAHLAHELAGD